MALTRVGTHNRRSNKARLGQRLNIIEALLERIGEKASKGEVVPTDASHSIK